MSLLEFEIPEGLLEFTTQRIMEDEEYCRLMKAVAEEQRAEGVPDADAELFVPLLMKLMGDERVATFMRHFERGGYMPPNGIERVMEDLETKRQVLWDLAETDGVLTEATFVTLLRYWARPYSSHPEYRTGWEVPE